MNCPKCGDFLWSTPVVKWRADGSTKRVGMQKFCKRRGCRYEGPITK